MKSEEKAYERFDLLTVDEGAVRTLEIEEFDPSLFAHLEDCVDPRDRGMFRNDIRHIRIPTYKSG